MQTYRVETMIRNDRTLTIKGLPFYAGDKVEIIVHGHKYERERTRRYPLRGKSVRYVDPFQNVAEDDWGALQ